MYPEITNEPCTCRGAVAKRILEEAKGRPFVEWGQIEVPYIVKCCLPSNDYGTDNYHFQYDDEFDLDPTFV